MHNTNIMSILDGIEVVGNSIEKVGNAIDQNVESEEERQAMLTERLRIDMASDSWLSKNIRPVITLACFVLQLIVFVAIFFKIEVPAEVSISVSGLLATCIGFYFNSRRNEKIAGRKTIAAIRIEELKLKSTIKETKKDNRVARKAKRRASRDE